MRGIEFIDPLNPLYTWNTADNWGLVMTGKVIGTPTIKEKIVDLKDRDGVLDFTNALLGVPAYNTRELSFDFEYLDDLEEWPNLFATICGRIHGKRCEIYDPDDLGYHYVGRVSVGSPTGGRVKTFSITVKADTWKYKSGETVVTEAVEADKTIVLQNDWRPVSPTITTTGAVTFSFDGVNYSIAGAGTFRFPKIRLAYGANRIAIVSGSGEITFKYQEGAM